MKSVVSETLGSLYVYDSMLGILAWTPKMVVIYKDVLQWCTPTTFILPYLGRLRSASSEQTLILLGLSPVGDIRQRDAWFRVDSSSPFCFIVMRGWWRGCRRPPHRKPRWKQRLSLSSRNVGRRAAGRERDGQSCAAQARIDKLEGQRLACQGASR